MAFLSSFFKSFYGKALLVIIIGAIGILAGVKIGYTYFLDEKKVAFVKPQSSQELSLSFIAGDLFPWENYTTKNGDTLNFEQLLVGKESLIFFVESECQTCLDLLTLWQKEVKQELRSGVQQIAFIPSTDSTMPEQYVSLFEGFNILYYNETYWRERYNNTNSPILIGVDNSGFVVHQQIGFEGYIQYPIVNRFCLGR